MATDSLTNKVTPSSSLFASALTTVYTNGIHDKTEGKVVANVTAPPVVVEVKGEEEVGKKRQFHIVKGGKMDAFFVKKVMYGIHHILFCLLCIVCIMYSMYNVCTYSLLYIVVVMHTLYTIHVLYYICICADILYYTVCI